MKKYLSILLALCMVFALAACGGSGDSSSTGDTGDTADTGDTGDTGDAADTGDTGSGAEDVAVFYYNFADPFMSTVRADLDADLTDAGVKFQNYDGGNNQSTQNDQIDTAISNGVKLLVVNIVTSGSSDASSAVCEKAAAAGIPVIFFNRAPEEDGNAGAVLGKYENVAFVGTDAPEAGHMQGQMIGDYLLENYDAVDLNKDGSISYVMFMGDAANVEAIYRTQYGVEDANKVLTDAGKPELVYFDAAAPENARYQLDQNGAWSSQAALDYMSTNLSQYSEANGNMIELVIANNDDMALGAIQALQTAGYNTGEEGTTTIPVFGVDATEVAQQAIAQGTMTGSVKQDGTGMADAVCKLVQNVLGGDELLAGTEDYVKDTANQLDNKIFIPYQPYAG